MKHLIIAIAAIFCFASCKKEEVYKVPGSLQSVQQFFSNIQNKLKDSLSASDYNKVNFSQIYKSKDVQSNHYFIRIGLLNKSFATDFILLQTDSLGNVTGGKLIHVDKEKLNKRKDKKFNGRFIISSLNRQHTNTQEVVNGKWKSTTGATAMAKPEEEAEEPAGEQILPDVVVTSYIDSDTGMDWYWYEGLYTGGSSSGYGSETGYTYGAADPGGGSSSNTVSEDNTIIIEIEANDNPAIDVSKYIKCFSTIADLNATYNITIFSEVPVNSDPAMIFNPSTNSPGHSFIQLRKANGANIVQQNIGFYPNTNWKSLSGFPVESKVVDNEDHEYNASLAVNINASQFQAALDRMQEIAGMNYDIKNWNCTDFALSVFNAAASAPLLIPGYIIPGNITLSNTPQGLYSAIKNLEISGNTSYGTPEVPGVCGYAGDSHGACQ